MSELIIFGTPIEVILIAIAIMAVGLFVLWLIIWLGSSCDPSSIYVSKEGTEK
jgi:uncharacterized membrane protein